MYRCFSLSVGVLDLFQSLLPHTSVHFRLYSSLQLKPMFRTIVPRPYPPVLIAPGSHLTIIGKLHIANGLNGVQQKRVAGGFCVPIVCVYC